MNIQELNKAAALETNLTSFLQTQLIFEGYLVKEDTKLTILDDINILIRKDCNDIKFMDLDINKIYKFAANYEKAIEEINQYIKKTTPNLDAILKYAEKQYKTDLEKQKECNTKKSIDIPKIFR